MAGLGSLSNKVNEMINDYLKVYGVRRNREYDRLSVRIQIQILHDYSGWKNVGSVSGTIEVKEGRVIKDPNRLVRELYDKANGYTRNITYYSATAYDVSVGGYSGVLHARVE